MNGNKNINELAEKQFLENYNPDEYARQSVTVDLMILGVNEDYSSLRILLVKRDEHPHKGRWGLPGGFIKEDETAYASATRVLNNKTHLKNVYLDQIYTFTKPDKIEFEGYPFMCMPDYDSYLRGQYGDSLS